jgi:serine/threonine protein phosphatase 1
VKVSYVIGDIHGCYKELLKLERLIKVHARREGWQYRIVSVGDLIDRGPKSADVVDHMMKGWLAGTHRCVMGNHEGEFLRLYAHFRPDVLKACGIGLSPFLRSMDEGFASEYGRSMVSTFEEYVAKQLGSWLNYGGMETLASYGIHNGDLKSLELPPAHLGFLMQLPLVWEDSHCLVTHALTSSHAYGVIKAGIVPGKRSVLQDAVHLTFWNRNLPNQLVDLEKKRWHVSGHTPCEGVEQFERIKELLIDTACVYGNKLTAYCVKAHKTLVVNSGYKWRDQPFVAEDICGRHNYPALT